MENVQCQIWPGPVEGYRAADYRALEKRETTRTLIGIVASGALVVLSAVIAHKTQSRIWNRVCLISGATWAAATALAAFRLGEYQRLAREQSQREVGAIFDELDRRSDEVQRAGPVSDGLVPPLWELALEAAIRNGQLPVGEEKFPNGVADKAVEIAMLCGIDRFRAVLPHVTITRLDLSLFGARVDDQLLQEIAAAQPTLKELELKGSSLTNAGLSHFHHLESLAINGSSRIDAELILGLPETLEVLHLKDCARVNASAVGQRLGRFSNMLSFWVEGCSGDWSQAVGQLPQEKLLELKVDRVGVEWVQGCVKLEFLELFTPVAFDREMPQLRRLVVRGQLEGEARESVVAHLPALESLEVHGFMNDAFLLRELLQKLALRELKLPMVVSFDPLLNLLREHGQKLTSLGVWVPRDTDWDDLRGFLAAFPKLERLRIAGCPFEMWALGPRVNQSLIYADEGDQRLEQLLDSLPQIRDFEISGYLIDPSVEGAIAALRGRELNSYRLGVHYPERWWREGAQFPLDQPLEMAKIFRAWKGRPSIWGGQALRLGAENPPRLPFCLDFTGGTDWLLEAQTHLERVDGSLQYEAMSTRLEPDHLSGNTLLQGVIRRMPRLNWLDLDVQANAPLGLFSQLRGVATVVLRGDNVAIVRDAVKNAGEIQLLCVHGSCDADQWRSMLRGIADPSALPHIRSCTLTAQEANTLCAEFPGLSMTGTAIRA